MQAANRLPGESWMKAWRRTKDRKCDLQLRCLAARQDRGNDAIELIDAVPRENWTEGMTALAKRVQYGQYLDGLRAQERNGDFNALANSIGTTPKWRAEPEVQALEQNLQRKRQVRLRMSYENAIIDGDEGVSRIDSDEIPLQLDLPLDFERTLFLRADTLNANSGRVNPATASNFAKLGTTLPTDPAIASDRLDQNYKGHVVGVGGRKPNNTGLIWAPRWATTRSMTGWVVCNGALAWVKVHCGLKWRGAWSTAACCRPRGPSILNW